MTDQVETKVAELDVEAVKTRVKELSLEGMQNVQEYLKTILKPDEEGSFEVPDELKEFLLELSLIKEVPEEPELSTN